MAAAGKDAEKSLRRRRSRRAPTGSSRARSPARSRARSPIGGKNVERHRQGDLPQGQGGHRHRLVRVLRQRPGAHAQPDRRHGRRRVARARTGGIPDADGHQPVRAARATATTSSRRSSTSSSTASCPSSTRPVGRCSSTARPSTRTASAARTSRPASSSSSSATKARSKRWCWYKVGCKGPVTYAPVRHQPLERPRVVVHPRRPVHGLLGRQLLERLQPAAATPVPNIAACPRSRASRRRRIGVGLTAATGVALGAHLVGPDRDRGGCSRAGRSATQATDAAPKALEEGW